MSKAGNEEEYVVQNEKIREAIKKMNNGMNRIKLHGLTDVVLEDWLALAGALEGNTTLKELRLGGNQIADEGAKALAEGLKENKRLIVLQLNDNQIGDEGAKALAEFSKGHKLILLSLNNNQIGDEGAKAFAVTLRENTSASLLSLNNNQIGNEGAKYLVNALEMNEYTYLHCYNNERVENFIIDQINTLTDENDKREYRSKARAAVARLIDFSPGTSDRIKLILAELLNEANPDLLQQKMNLKNEALRQQGLPEHTLEELQNKLSEHPIKRSIIREASGNLQGAENRTLFVVGKILAGEALDELCLIVKEHNKINKQGNPMTSLNLKFTDIDEESMGVLMDAVKYNAQITSIRLPEGQDLPEEIIAVLKQNANNLGEAKARVVANYLLDRTNKEKGVNAYYELAMQKILINTVLDGFDQDELNNILKSNGSDLESILKKPTYSFIKGMSIQEDGASEDKVKLAITSQNLSQEQEILNSAKEAFAQNKGGKSGASDSFRQKESQRKDDKGKGEASGYGRKLILMFASKASY